MQLSNRQFQELQLALNDAFHTMTSLEQMLSFELSKNLRAIAAEGSLQEMAFKLIQTADSQGWVEDLICAACNSNPGNQKLQSILQKFSLKKSNDLRRIIEERLECEYDNLEELGTGAFGITYRATTKNEQKDIVLKTLKLEEVYQVVKFDTQETSKQFNQAIKSFEKEAEILSSFPKNPHIVRYFNYLTQKCKLLRINNLSNNQDRKFYSIYELELVFLVMEYIEGENLEELVSKRGSPLEEAEALRYIKQIGEALTVVHSKGVLHRDIKPKNIMVRKTTNDAVLIDFGIAREFNPNVTQTHTVSFTQGYAPPEQLDPKAKRGNYTDIYGLAATLYYLLTKEHPSHALFRITQPLDEPKKINSNISDSVNEAILWGMELELNKRPQTVQDWLVKLCLQTPIQLKPSQEVFLQHSILESAPRDNLNQKENAIAKYRQVFEEFLADDGEISFVESEILNDLQQKLELTEEEARAVRDEVLKPFGIYKENLDKYRQVFTKFVEKQGYPLSQKAKVDLKKLQKYYQLKDEDIALLFKEAEQQQADDLSSQKGVDYTKLQDLLKAGQWQEADEETRVVMLKASGREEEDCLDDEDIENFPWTDLLTIDRLWVKYSNGRFGFSVQKRIWESIGQDEYEFGDRLEKWYVGWRNWEEEEWDKVVILCLKFGETLGWMENGEFVYEKFRFDASAPEGHLPLTGHCYMMRGYEFPLFFSLVETCKQSLGLLDGNVALVEQSVIALKEAEYQRQLETKKLELQQQREAQRQQPDDLSSQNGVDYTKLRDLLKAGQWQEADEETVAVILKAALREEEGWLGNKDIKNFPCTDLCTIDQLWVKYSNGRFGFSVQKRISRLKRDFGTAIGWRKEWQQGTDDIDVTYDITAPEGHLPAKLLQGWSLWASIWDFFDRLKTCKQSLRLKDGDAALVEQSVIAPKEAEYQRQLETERLEQQQEEQQKGSQRRQFDDLSSNCGVDYTKLRDFLKAGQWKEADEETRAVMLKASGREKEGWIYGRPIKNFPCTDLRTIDQLWVKYSNGRFGFSVQKQIYLDVGGILDGEYYQEAWEKFGDRVGWRVKESWISYYSGKVTFDTNAPQGHLPRKLKGDKVLWGRVVDLFSRMETCQIRSC